MNFLNLKEVSEFLDVSQATVRNWTKQGYISFCKGNSYFLEEVTELKNEIDNGSFNRLQSRANKKTSKRNFIPIEYITDKCRVAEIEKLKTIFVDNHLSIEPAVFWVTVKFLAIRGEFQPKGELDKFYKSNKWKRNCVKEVMLDWYSSISPRFDGGYKKLYEEFSVSESWDILGSVYQSFLAEGNKSSNGSYFTPPQIVQNLFQCFNPNGKRFLDPCCGTGQFLLQAAKYTSIDKIFGFDIDPVAVRLAKINLLTTFSDTDFMPEIYNADTISEVADGGLFCSSNSLKASFDMIATNPPWGASYNSKNALNYRRLYPQISSGEIFSYFLIKCCELAKKGAFISFILPVSFLNIKVHRDIRKYVLKNTTVQNINCLGRRFENVFTPVIRLDVCNEPADNYHKIVIYNQDAKYNISQTRFLNNNNYVFDRLVCDQDDKIIKKVFSKPHITLKDNCQWALGIVTGNNKKFLKSSQIEGTEPIYKGSDIMPFRLKEASNFIAFEPEKFQQTAKKEKYRADEKLIYKFISKKLVFAFDANQSLTLNSANILIPTIEDYPNKLILAFLNSDLYQFVFMKKFDTHKVLRGDLETLPLPIVEKQLQERIIDLVDKAIEGAEITRELNRIVMNFYNLTDEQMRYVNKAVGK